MQTIADHADALSAKIANAATYGGGIAAFLGGVTATWVAAIGGIVIGIAGLVMKWYFSQQHLKLARQIAASQRRVEDAPD
jgi:hypothetical protein